MRDPVPDTFSTHGTTIGSADMFLRFRQPHENFRSHSMNASKSAWAHTTCEFWCFPNLLGIKINNSITRGSGEPGFVRGCIVGQPTTVHQTLHHPEYLWMPSPEEEKTLPQLLIFLYAIDFLINLVQLFYRLSYGYILSLSIYVLVASLKLDVLLPVFHVNWRLVPKGLLDSGSVFHKGESQEAHTIWWSHS